MQKHALDRATIAELILSRLPQDNKAQLFLLNFERLILQDFSIYDPPQDFKDKPRGAVVSEDYFSIIKELMDAELSSEQASLLQALIFELNKASSEGAKELARERCDNVVRLFRFFPQDCFAYIGGAFFEAFLKGEQEVRGFELKGQVYLGQLKILLSLYSPDSPGYSESPYTRECGRLVSWLNMAILPKKKWLYVAPVICDGSFFGLLYRFSDKKDKTVEAQLRVALIEAETLFRDMRYALIADVAKRIGRIEDPLVAFMAELPNYQNVAMVATFSEEGESVVYARAFVKEVDASCYQSAGRRLTWQPMPSAYIYAYEESVRLRELSTLSSSIGDNWVEVTKDDTQVQMISLTQEEVRLILRNDVVRAYEEAGLPLRFGVIIPGKLIGSDFSQRHLELYFFEPAEVDIKKEHGRFLQGTRRKLYNLIPLLQEIAILGASAEERARTLNQIIASLVFHEVKNALIRKTEPAGSINANNVPIWLHEHVNRCLEAYGDLKTGTCSQSDWAVVVDWLKSYWSHYFKESIQISEWPQYLTPIRLSKELIYVIACELIKNAIDAGARFIEVTLTYELTSQVTALSVTNDGVVNFNRLQSNLNNYWESGLMASNRHGLFLIMQLLRVMHSTQALPVRADRLNHNVRIQCYLSLV